MVEGEPSWILHGLERADTTVLCYGSAPLPLGSWFGDSLAWTGTHYVSRSDLFDVNTVESWNNFCQAFIICVLIAGIHLP